MADKATPERASIDDLYRALTNPRRRRILLCLEEVTGSVPLEHLAHQVAALEASASGEEQGAAQRVRMALYHVHLPMLAEVGLIEYDRDTGAVRQKSYPDRVTDALHR